MVRVIRANSDMPIEHLKFKLEKPAFRNYYFVGDVNKNMKTFIGQVSKLAAYDDAEYYWAQIYWNGQVEYILNGKVKDKSQLWSYEPDDYEDYETEYDGFYEYINDAVESVAEILKDFNKDIKPRMMYD